jgi:NADPH:quinone reductase-like Zn-dependent oxidoreductase
VPGSDAAGEVDAVGPGVNDLAPGDRCLVSPVRSCGRCAHCHGGRQPYCDAFHVWGTAEPGAYAEYVVAARTDLLPIPAELPWVEAACLPVAGLTAWHMLVTRARLAPGETVLVHGAGGGVGLFAVQIARLCGARVLATVGDDAKVEKARVLGADAVIHHGREDFAERVRELTDGRGADVVLDHVGAAFFARNLDCLARGGRLVVCGTTTGGDVAFHLRDLFAEQRSILGVRLGGVGELHHLVGLAAEGRVRPLVDSTFPLEGAAEAHARVASRAAFGKVVLTLA